MSNLGNWNPQQLMAMAAQLGIGKKGEESSDGASLKDAAEKLSGKSDEELIEEVKKLKSSMDQAQLQKQMQSLKMVRNLLNQEQQTKFDQIMAILTEE